MKELRITLLFSMIVLISISCTEEAIPEGPKTFIITNTIPVTDCPEEERAPCEMDDEKVNIRIRNMSRYAMCNFIYEAYNEPSMYGDIEPGVWTCYRPFDMAYRFPNRASYTDFSGVIRLGATDFVGETPLSNGRYNFNHTVIRCKERPYAFGRMTLSDGDIDYTTHIGTHCDNEPAENCGANPDSVNLRIVNESIFQFCNFRYTDIEGNEYDFGNIQTGESSCYAPLSSLNKYNFKASFSINDLDFELDQTLPNFTPYTLRSGSFTMSFTLSSLREEDVIYLYEEGM